MLNSAKTADYFVNNFSFLTGDCEQTSHAERVIIEKWREAEKMAQKIRCEAVFNMIKRKRSLNFILKIERIGSGRRFFDYPQPAFTTMYLNLLLDRLQDRRQLEESNLW